MVGLLVGVAALLVLVAVAAATALGGGGKAPPARPLPQAIHDSLSGQKIDGVTARVRFTTNLFSGMTTDQSSALLKGGSGRLWLAPHKLRVELQSDNGDAQVVFNQGKGFVYDGPSDTAYTFAAPAGKKDSARRGKDSGAVPTVAQIEKKLTQAQRDVAIGGPDSQVIGGQPAYEVRVTPKQSGGLVGAAQFAWDAANGVPLKIAVYARGSSTPALALEVTDISFGAVDPSVFDVAPPSGAKTVDLGGRGGGGAARDHKPAASFRANAPATLGPRARRELKQTGDGYVALYGKGLDTIAVLEHPAKVHAKQPASNSRDNRGPLELPSGNVNGAKATVVGTPLGGLVSFERGGISYTVAGSQPVNVLRAAAAGL